MTSTRRVEGLVSGGHMRAEDSENAQCGHPHRTLEPIDVILFSFRAKKLAFFGPVSPLDGIKMWKIFVNIN